MNVDKMSEIMRDEGFDLREFSGPNPTRATFYCPCGRLEKAFSRTSFSEYQLRASLRRHLADFNENH